MDDKFLTFAKYGTFDAYILKENKCCLHIIDKSGRNITYVAVPPTNGNRMDIINISKKLSVYDIASESIVIKIITGIPELISCYE